MMNSEYEKLFEKAIKGGLNQQEKEAWDLLLESDPSLLRAWAEEQALEETLGTLPNAPVSTNFTALVLQRVFEPSKPVRARITWSWFRLARVSAVAGVAVCAGFLIYHQHEMALRRDMAESIASVTKLASVLSAKSDASKVSPVELWQDFDAIYRLAQARSKPELDQELYLALENR